MNFVNFLFLLMLPFPMISWIYLFRHRTRNAKIQPAQGVQSPATWLFSYPTWYRLVFNIFPSHPTFSRSALRSAMAAAPVFCWSLEPLLWEKASRCHYSSLHRKWPSSHPLCFKKIKGPDNPTCEVLCRPAWYAFGKRWVVWDEWCELVVWDEWCEMSCVRWVVWISGVRWVVWDELCEMSCVN